MKKVTALRYDGPGRILHAFGLELPRGGTGLFTESEALSLQAQPAIHVSPTGDDEPEAHQGEGHNPDPEKEN
jgi:hypothetical protein